MDRSKAAEAVKGFRCPRYQELPAMALYLEQMLGVVNGALRDILDEPITSPMINNYIKSGALPPPVRKRYSREHLCYAIVIGILKPVFTVQQMSRFFDIQRESYPLDVAYDYFCTDFENALKEAFSFTGQALPSVETRRTEQTILARSIVLAAANRVYAVKCYL